MKQPEAAGSDFRRTLLGGKFNLRIHGVQNAFTQSVQREFAESEGWSGEGEADLTLWMNAADIPRDFEYTVALGGGVYYSYDPQALLFTTRNKGQQQFNKRDIRMILYGDIIAGSKFSLHVSPTAATGSYLRRLIRAVMKGTTATQLNSDVSVFMSRLIEPLLYLSLPHKGMSLLHAAAVEKDGDGLLVFGVRDVGKTTTAMMLTRKGYSLMSDDLCLLDYTGEIGAFLKPLKVEGPLLMADSDSRKNLARLPMSERFLWNAARWGMQRNPKYLFLRLTPSELIPPVKTSQNARLRHVFFLENRTHRKNVVEDMSSSTAVDMALAHLDIEFEALVRHQEYVHSLAMVIGIDARALVREQYDRIRSIIESGFAGTEAKLITLTPGDDHDFAATTIMDIVGAG